MTEVNEPPRYTDAPATTIAETVPFADGAHEVTLPFEANAATRVREEVEPEVEVTEEN